MMGGLCSLVRQVNEANRDGTSPQRMKRRVHDGIAHIDARTERNSYRNTMALERPQNCRERHAGKIGVRGAGNYRFALQAVLALTFGARVCEVYRDPFQ